MNESSTLRYLRVRWPEAEAPVGEPLWFLYEVDQAEDVVVRSVEIFPDATITRNSIALEQRNGDDCPSLFDCSLSEGFAGVELDEILAAEFERFWRQGTDKPFWFRALR
jgi:hypothetical protein